MRRPRLPDEALRSGASARSAPRPVPARLPLIDALKALASQLIVLHHLSIYGPMAEIAHPIAPSLLDAVAEHGRLAVQVFLVIAGFLAAGALAPAGSPRIDAPAATIRRRWLRLAGPYIAAVLLTIGAITAARLLSDSPTLPAAPTAGQVAANLAMLQDVLGLEAVSAGAWYVAIDLQLYACLVLLLWAARRLDRPAAAPLLVGALAIASLFGFNRDPDWDPWAPYFFGSYAFGVFAAWIPTARRPGLATVALAVLGLLALWVEFRTRIALALATALLLAWSARQGLLAGLRIPQWVGWLGRISFSVFLVHYAVIVLFDAGVSRWLPDEPVVHALALLAAFVASTAAGALFHRWVEAPLAPSARPGPVITPRPVTGSPGSFRS